MLYTAEDCYIVECRVSPPDKIYQLSISQVFIGQRIFLSGLLKGIK